MRDNHTETGRQASKFADDAAYSAGLFILWVTLCVTWIAKLPGKLIRLFRRK